MVVVALGLMGCTKGEKGGANKGAGDEAALAKAEGAAKKLGGTLKGKLMAAMQEGGATKAAEVCAKDAQVLVGEVRKESGVRVGRSSLRLRNDADVGPEWVEAWLKAQGERKAEGVKGVREVVETAEGKVARVLMPIAVEGPCLLCHGDPANIAPEVKKTLEERYPKDKATGYALGDLRGALWAEVAVGE